MFREEEEEEEEEEEGLFRANAVNEEDPERDRATQVGGAAAGEDQESVSRHCMITVSSHTRLSHPAVCAPSCVCRFANSRMLQDL